LPSLTDEEDNGTGGIVPGRSRIAGRLLVHAYRLLLQQPGIDLRKFADQLACSDEDGRTILEALAELQLLQGVSGGSQSTVAVSPVVAMLRVIAQEQLFLSGRQQFLKQSYDTFASIISVYSAGIDDAGGEAFAEQLPDPAAVRLRLEELFVGAKHEVLSFTPAVDGLRLADPLSHPRHLTAVRRGIRVQALYHDAVAFDPVALASAEQLVDAGAELRLAARPPLGLLIIDRETGVLPRDLADPDAGALVIREGITVLALAALFESYWRHGRPLLSDDGRAQYCSPAERAVLGLLAAGAKDDSVARQLGTSVRTIRRIVADLMVRAQVDSLFALGVYAAANDWI